MPLSRKLLKLDEARNPEIMSRVLSRWMAEVDGALSNPGDAEITYLGDVIRNTLLETEAFATSPWQVQNNVGSPTVTANAATDPNGGSTADVFAANFPAIGGSQFIQLVQPYVSTTTANRTFSVYLKSNTACTCYIWVYNGSVDTSVACSLTTSWQRFSVNNVAGNVATWYVQIGNNRWGAGQPAITATEIHCWGAQLEAAASPSTYQSVGAAPTSDWGSTWENYDALETTHSKVGYYKDLAGIVHLVGAVKNTVAANRTQTIFTLPEAYRPRKKYGFTAYGTIAATKDSSLVTVDSDGDVAWEESVLGTAGAVNRLFLDGISFPVEAA